MLSPFLRGGRNDNGRSGRRGAELAKFIDEWLEGRVWKNELNLPFAFAHAEIQSHAEQQRVARGALKKLGVVFVTENFAAELLELRPTLAPLVDEQLDELIHERDFHVGEV